MQPASLAIAIWSRLTCKAQWVVSGIVKPHLYPQGLRQACARTLRWSRTHNTTGRLVMFGVDVVLCGELIETKLDGGGLDEPEDGDGERRRE